MGPVTGDRLTVADVADRLNIRPSTWRAYVARGKAPQPDGWHDLRTPWWHPGTVDDWDTSRPGRGTRTGLNHTD